MTSPTPTRVTIDPPMGRWRVTPRNGRSTPVIATGHQPTLWHPGILAKDLAAAACAKHLGGSAVHVVVDHNPVGPAALDVPVRQGEALHQRRIAFAGEGDGEPLPPNRLPPIPPSVIGRALAGVEGQACDRVRPGLNQIAGAYAATAGEPDRAAQTTSVLGRLKGPCLAQSQGIWSTDRVVTQAFVARLLEDPVGCVRCYNRAALAYPEAGIRPLYRGRDVVEAPLWAQGGGRCTPVYIDLGDSRSPQLFTQGQALGLTGPEALRWLRPRATTLSALMRSEHCDLFIHGTGGAVYDRVTERWWRDWVGEPLAPMAVVSADVFLPLDAPVATRDALERAVWFEHHLPFNVDRFTEPGDGVEAGLVREKHGLLERMGDDRDKRRRAAAFKRIHAINAELRARHADRLAQAKRQAESAAVGVGNAAIARRRDWCFALYPHEALRDLGQAIDGYA